MELKDKEIQLNLLKKDGDGNFTSAEKDQCQEPGIIYKYNKNQKKKKNI